MPGTTTMAQDGASSGLPAPIHRSLTQSSSGSLNMVSTTPMHAKQSAQQAAASQRQADQYLSELLSYSLDRLRREPELLKQEKEQIERNIQATAVSQYGAFIETARCLETISTELGSVRENLDSLLQNIPDLASACESFSAQSAEVLEQHTQNKHLANGQSTLLELLEVPQLMDTCVRNGIYDEALDLQAFVARLGLLHPDVPVVKILMQQVTEVGQTMLHQLLSRLKSSIQLPECLRIMGYLRRIAAFSEAELRLQFLQCRDEWLSSLVDELDESDSYEYLKHLTDVHRLHMFDAVMQYRAIFFDAPAPTTATGADAAGGVLSASGAANVRETSMLYSWVQHRLSLYLSALKRHLPAVNEGGNLASVLEHCMYCGSSLARVGLDFQGLLLPLFEECALNLFATHLAHAVDAFNTKLESHKWVPMPVPMLHKSRSEKSTVAGSSGGAAGGEGGEEGATGAAPAPGAPEDLSPPQVIMEHLPLAVFTNAVLSALNELRHCALQSLGKPASGLLQQGLEHVSATMLHFRHTHALGDGELPLFRSAARAMLDVVLPYLASCFGRIFTGSSSKLDTSSAAAILRSLVQEI